MMMESIDGCDYARMCNILLKYASTVKIEQNLGNETSLNYTFTQNIRGRGRGFGRFNSRGRGRFDTSIT